MKLRNHGFSIALVLAIVSPVFAQTTSTAGSQDFLGNQPITRTTFREVAKKVSPAVANIKIKSNIVFGKAHGKGMLPPSFGDEEMRDLLGKLFEQNMPYMTPNDEEEFKYSRSASGVIMTPDGYIVTSNHVITEANPDDIEVSLPDGRTFDNVKVIGTDELTDLAVLKVDGQNLPVIAWGDSEHLEVGDWVLAIGNPLEFNNSVSEGIVSAKHRIIKKAPIEDLIQTTAMINPGNSGGALVNLNGQLIGINMAIATSTGMWSGLGFAIPSKTARDITNQLMNNGKVARGYLGIEMSPLTTQLARQLNYDENLGIVVKNVRPGSAAERAGLQRYDIIARVNGKDIKEINDMHRNIGARPSGDSVSLEIYRGEGNDKATKKIIDVQLGERPSQSELEKEHTTTVEPKVPGTRPQRGTLGLQVSPSPDGTGVIVDDVEQGSRAAKAGVQKGDVILEVNKQTVKSVQDVQKALHDQTSDSHLLYIERKGQSNFVPIPAE
jgi:serine protease Do